MAVADFKSIPGISRRERAITGAAALQEQQAPDLTSLIPQPSHTALQASKQVGRAPAHWHNTVTLTPKLSCQPTVTAAVLQAGLTRDVNCLKHADRRKRLAAVSLTLSML